MPTYASLSDLNQFFSAANVTDWADRDRDGSVNLDEQLTVEAGIEASEAMIDAYLRKGGYAAPFDPAAHAALPPRLRALLKQWTVIITGYYLHAWRGLRDKVNPFDALYRDALSQLTAVARGRPLADLARQSNVTFGTGQSTKPTDNLAALKADGWNW